MTLTEFRSIALLIGAVGLAACLPDEFAYEYDWLHPETLASGSDIPLDTLFPGRWEHVCIQAPGSPSIGLVEELGLYSGAEWMSDGRLHDSDFTTSVYKIVVLSEKKFKIYMMSHRYADFERARYCTDFENKSLKVEVVSVPSQEDRRVLTIGIRIP